MTFSTLKTITSSQHRQGQCVQEAFGTLPAGLAGGLDADLDQNIFRGSVLSAVISSHSQLVHALFSIVQLLCVFDEA